MIEIMNLKKAKPSEAYDFFIDRHKSPVGNPYVEKQGVKESERDAVCDKYETYFNSKVVTRAYTPFHEYLNKIKAAYIKYGKVRLFCWCAPKRCHGETIKRWLENN